MDYSVKSITPVRGGGNHLTHKHLHNTGLLSEALRGKAFTLVCAFSFVRLHAGVCLREREKLSYNKYSINEKKSF